MEILDCDIMEFEGYASCPGCGFDSVIGRFEGSIFVGVTDNATVVELAAGVQSLDNYQGFKVFKIICSNCGLIYQASTMISVKPRMDNED